MAQPLRGHPDYAAGYSAGWDGDALPNDASQAFQAGHEAARDAVAVFESNGFYRVGNGFGRTLTIDEEDNEANL